jgi:hypothetical protein
MGPEFANHAALEIILGLPADCLALIGMEVFRAYLTFRKCRPFGEEDDEHPTKTKDRQTKTATVNDNAAVETSESHLLLVERFMASEGRR